MTRYSNRSDEYVELWLSGVHFSPASNKVCLVNRLINAATNIFNKPLSYHKCYLRHNITWVFLGEAVQDKIDCQVVFTNKIEKCIRWNRVGRRVRNSVHLHNTSSILQAQLYPVKLKFTYTLSCLTPLRSTILIEIWIN